MVTVEKEKEKERREGQREDERAATFSRNKAAMHLHVFDARDILVEFLILLEVVEKLLDGPCKVTKVRMALLRKKGVLCARKNHLTNTQVETQAKEEGKWPLLANSKAGSSPPLEDAARRA